METKSYLIRDIPKDLWRIAKQKAAEEDVALRDVILTLIRAWVDGRVRININRRTSKDDRGNS